jgi:hypothetical protein
LSILSDFEDSIARAVEGVFAGVFRSRVQPAELAKALGKEMDSGRVVGVGKVYAPNLYTIVISPADEERMGSFTETLGAELATYLAGYAREKGYSLDARPLVRFRVHDSLKLGRFEAVGELVSTAELAEAAEEEGFYVPDSAARAAGPAAAPSASALPAAAPAGPTARPGPGVTLPPSALAAARSETPEAPPLNRTLRALSTLTVSGVEHDIVLQGGRLVIGRAPTCDIALPDANISRQHAELVAEGSGWTLGDLNSTNGTFVNGAPVQRVRLRDGDVIALGVSELLFHEPRG